MRSKPRLFHYPAFSVAGLMVLIVCVALYLSGVRWINAVWPTVMVRQSVARMHDLELNRWTERMEWADEPDVSLAIIPDDPRNSSDPYYRQPALFYQLRLIPRTTPRRETPGQLARRRAEIRAVCQEQMEYHKRMRRKWSWAAWFPWKSVDPDGLGPPSDSAASPYSTWSGKYGSASYSPPFSPSGSTRRIRHPDF